jgi:hypothetical protein
MDFPCHDAHVPGHACRLATGSVRSVSHFAAAAQQACHCCAAARARVPGQNVEQEAKQFRPAEMPCCLQ